MANKQTQGPPWSPNSKNILEETGHELKVNPPKILAKTAMKYGPERARKQRVAILLNKSRKAGARVPGMAKSIKGPSGGY